ncbi:ABC-three component system middle component 8 [Porphyromonas levii]|uniref:ABC-three component system middle component 8 n=1 Tax=Porphyromonas levii TaxID=28114 RepID=UPI001070DF2E|nr:ABC-three component system middle component 8 [Porphyromonas levii]TFH94684.1 hypothetical protein E4P48_09870 [Porphyromonas levii]
MIGPNKHTDIRTSVPYIAGLLLKEVSADGIIKYDDLKRYVAMKVGHALGDNFEYALSFLFLLNRIEYNQSLDSIVMVL